ncbi:rhomboid family intramembrane serine protease [Paenibacillus sp. FSL H8-0548]|uniref:rhomboid family intramembrane serine protease n=1 Tax=Paenibacillus sp. FSL H8-0548 TaxID=1920422 RepID=UPI00096D8F65|nr:rhomboid family intramembrane serine protease [Paenibacillus sp. FSL H8-0548]OMF22392.1 rhomboid family intramembrane serine protease [Paenibacillus sp. FSL H8-0548]
MIFLRYESFRSYLKLYPITAALIALNLAYFIVVALNGDPNNAYHAYKYGAFATDVEIDPYGLQQPWRYVTSMFMHSGIEHLLYNMFALLVFAPPLEYLLKQFRYAGFYLICGIAGNGMSALMNVIQSDMSPHIGVGASGAIYGIYGAFLYLSLFRKTQLDESSRKTVYVILVFGVVYSILVPQIDLWAHVGGALAGFILYHFFDRIKSRRHQ